MFFSCQEYDIIIKREPSANASILRLPQKLSNRVSILIEEDDCVVKERSKIKNPLHFTLIKAFEGV